MKKTFILSITLLLAGFQVMGQAHFVPVYEGNGETHMNIYISGASIGGSNMVAGDEIGIFDGANCVGAGILTQELTGEPVYLSIVAVKDDETTPEIDGYITGNDIFYRLWDASESDEITGVSVSLIAGSSTFADGGTASVTLAAAAPNSAPYFTSSPGKAAEENLLYSYTASAADDDGDLLTWSAETMPEWLSFNTASRVLSGTPAHSDVGDHMVTLRVTDGINSVDQTFTITVSVCTPPSRPGIGSINQPTCLAATGSIEFTGLPASGTWTLTQYPGAINTAGTGETFTLSGFEPDTYTFTVTNETGCTSLATNDVVINAQPVQTAPVVGSITQPTCVVTTGSISLTDLPAAGTWTLTRYPDAVITTGDGTSVTVSLLNPGTYTFAVTNASGCTSVVTGSIVINDIPSPPLAPIEGTITHPTCSESGSIVLNGLPATGAWTVTRSPGNTSFTGTGTTTTISGMNPGAYTFTVTDALGCISPASSEMVFNDAPSAPEAPSIGTITHPTCILSTGTISLNSLPASGAWTLTMNPGSVTSSGSGTTAKVTALISGTYSFTVTNSSGCTSAASSDAVINAQPVQSAPTVGTIIHPTCITLTGTIPLSNLPSAGTWILTRNPGAITSTGTGSTTDVSGLDPGTYTFMVKNSDGCTSNLTGNAVIYNVPANPPAPVAGNIVHTTCTVETGSIELCGLPASGSWTLTRTPGGVATTGTGTSKTISGISSGTYSFTVTNSLGCISEPSASIVINSHAEAPAAPQIETIKQTTCAGEAGEVELSGLPATGIWILSRSFSDIPIYGAGTNVTITDLEPGTYTFSVATEEDCFSEASAEAIINERPESLPTPTITLSNNVLHSDAPDGNQWYNQNGLIGNATGQDYTPTANGDYYTIVTLDICSSDPSNTISFVVSSSGMDEMIKGLNLYPNPVDDEMTIEIPGNVERADYDILDAQGKIIVSGNFMERTTISTAIFPAGIYVIKIRQGPSFEYFKIMKSK